MRLRLFITGGTFDKEYNEIQGRLDFGESHVAEMLERGRSAVQLELRTLMMVDSLQMSDEDREIVVRNCASVPEDRIVITHGTDTMVETARAIATAQLPKTVVLTGAMVPYTFGSSDGLFNLGSALSFAQTLPVGVYVAMNGRYHRWDNVLKNRSTGRFEPRGVETDT